MEGHLNVRLMGKVDGMSLIKVLVLFGGPSSEHEVSLMSAASVLKQMDIKKYEIIPVGITPEGFFQLYEKQHQIQAGTWNGFEEASFQYRDHRKTVTLTPGEASLRIHYPEKDQKLMVDVAFPILHGPYGEDGVLQGLLEACRIPYVGSGVLASALAMDKGMTKKILERENINQAPYQVISLASAMPIEEKILETLAQSLSYPMFVKPARLGSSLGISKASNPRELKTALEKATAHDSKVVVEAFVEGREIECAVLGHHRNPRVALPAEIIPSREFYDYEDKYLAGKSSFQIPATLSEKEIATVQKMAIQVYQLLECEGLARVDFFLDPKSGDWMVNEINTMPGFTKISMYPKMWETSGMPYGELIRFLIEEALGQPTL